MNFKGGWFPVLVMVVVLAGYSTGCKTDDRTKFADVSCDTCNVVREYNGLALTAGGVISARMKEIQVLLGTQDAIDVFTMSCFLRDSIVDRRFAAGEIKELSKCDEERLAP